MPSLKQIQLAQIVNSHDFESVVDEALKIYAGHYQNGDIHHLQKAYELVKSLFAGHFPGYRACGVRYHDFRHTMDVLLAASRLLDGYNLARDVLPKWLARNLLVSALLHDTGYIQEEWDTEGTGAKYTREHEERSITFMKKNASSFDIEQQQVVTISRLIISTDMKRGFEQLPFASEEERDAGAILGSADLIGQMADREYLEKLLFLYSEFREAGISGYTKEFDILRKTQDFYKIIIKRLQKDYSGICGLARQHFKKRHRIDENLYLIAIEREMAYLDGIIADETTNFRNKLRRWEKLGPPEYRNA